MLARWAAPFAFLSHLVVDFHFSSEQGRKSLAVRNTVQNRGMGREAETHSQSEADLAFARV